MTDRVAPAYREIGRGLPRLEAQRKVTGKADYVHNLSVPGMLHAKIFRSTIPHGLIRSIDTAEALRVPGVQYVLTGEDICKLVRNPYYGPAFHDQPVLAIQKVRYVGEPVALVLADTPFAAAEGAQHIAAEYEEREPIYDEVSALTSPSVVHDELKPAGTFPDLQHLAGRRNTNVALHYQLRRGNVDTAFADAAHVFENEFRTQPVMHVPFEPMVSIAVPDDVNLIIHSSSQSPSFVRTEIARLLGRSESRVQVKVPHVGGGFGAKLYIKLEALVACAALITRRAVKCTLTMEEQFYTITKHASTFRLRTAIDEAGRITARRCEVFWNGGAYADIGPRVTQKSGFTAAGPYNIENVSIDSYALYTNKPPAGALRGFGIPQLVWAYESQSDIIARALRIDPLEFRQRNILRDGGPQATGTPTTDAQIDKVLETIASKLEWGKPFDRGGGVIRRGRGLAIGFKASIAPTTSVALVTIAADGSVQLATSTVDMGQGSDTAMAQIVAETLGIRTDDVVVIHPDTNTTPYDMATLGSRSTFHMGHAVRRAAEHAKEQLASLANEVGVAVENEFRPAAVFRKRYGMQAGTIHGTGTFVSTHESPDTDGLSLDITPFWMVGGTGIELEVDTETGQVVLTKMVNVADCGTPINPRIVETQLSGAAIMQLGFTMSECMEFDSGQVTNASLSDYRVPGIHDIPCLIENHTVISDQRNGPYGAKGVGETATFGVSPAVANAIEDAVGVRIADLPLTAEKVLHAIRASAGIPLKDQ